VSRLREALLDAPAAQRILIHSNNPSLTHSKNPPPLAAEGRVGVFTLPMSDTVKEVVDGRVRRTVPRETLVRLMGPWVFDREALVDALSVVAGQERQITDMIGLCESARLRVRALPTQ
jgi:2-C-methyl-D-erythritol 4-phosphate cytidylyltransferase